MRYAKEEEEKGKRNKTALRQYLICSLVHVIIHVMPKHTRTHSKSQSQRNQPAIIITTVIKGGRQNTSSKKEKKEGKTRERNCMLHAFEIVVDFGMGFCKRCGKANQDIVYPYRHA